MTFEEIKEHEFTQRCSFSTDWDAYSKGWDAAMAANARIIANESAWQRYTGTQTYKAHREDFDHGWDAGYRYAIGVEHAERHQMTLLIAAQERLIADLERALEAARAS